MGMRLAVKMRLAVNAGHGRRAASAAARSLALLLSLHGCPKRMNQLSSIPELLRSRVEHACQILQAHLADWSQAQWNEALRVWAGSSFVREWCVRHPQQLAAMLRDEVPDLPQTQDVNVFDAALRDYRNQRMVRIAWQEISAQVSPKQTVTALSRLADECLSRVVDWHRAALQARHGQPRLRDGRVAQFCVIGLGKLGGCELNFSSDVDVIFAYSGAGETDGDKALSNEQYFVRLGQRIVRSLEQRSDNGFVFRVDLRLRPFGERSPIAHSQGNLEEYYEAHGREWERYAWIKARPVAGDLELAQDLIAALQPFVYRRYLDFGAIDSLRDMKGQIDAQVRKRGHEQDIKLGWGGIREVEFIVQVFQLVRGGAEPSLRSASLMQAMRAITKLGLYPAEQIKALREAYWFLRRVENCWQAQHDQQTHVLPNNEEPRLALACALGYSGWAALDAELQQQRAIVHAQFAALFAEPENDVISAQWQPWWDQQQEDVPCDWVEEQFLELRDKAHKRLSTEACQRLGELLAWLSVQFHDAATASRVLQVVEVLIGRGNYVSLLHDNPVARRQLINLCQRSPWLAQQMRQFPMVLSELLDPIRLYAPDERAVLAERLHDHLANLPVDDVEARMDVLRRMRNATMLRIAAADVSAALPIMRVSDRLSELAEEILRAGLEQVELQLRQRYPELVKPEFAVVAYGKLGGLELGYTSDLDLVFVYDGEQHGLPLDPPVFFTRLARKLIHFLATPTGAGVAYEIDTRLRPSGRSGLLVTSLQGLASYQKDQAWTWEHQALIRARVVAGSARLAEGFATLRQEVLALPRERAELLKEVQDMREKMRVSLAPADGSFHPKHSPGGIVDIEFLTQFAVLAYAREYPDIARFTDVIRILEGLQAAELIAAPDAESLADAYRQLRAHVHQSFLGGLDQPAPALLELAGQTALRVARLQQSLL